MSEAPRVSVVMPVFDAAATVARAVRSVLVQDFADWELVAIDDGSSDGSAAEVGRAAGGDPRVRLVRTVHGGIVAALEAGLAEARGRFIARMDADDEMLPARLGAQVALLEARPEIGVASCLVEFGGDAAAARGYALHVAWMNELLEPDEIARARFIESPLAHPSAMFRRELVAAHGGYAETGWPEDYELWLRWMEAGVRFAKVPRVLLRWHDPPARLSRTDGRYSESAFYACKCRHLARWLRREVAPPRRVFLWGAGRITRKRFAALTREGAALAGYLDIDPKKTGRVVGGLPVLAPAELPPRESCFVVVGVGTRGARELIRTALVARGFVEGADFILAA